MRASALQELARGWKEDPETLSIVKARAQFDADSVVRRIALRKLATPLKDDTETLNLFLASSESDPDPAVRRAAVEALAHGSKEEVKISEWLKARIDVEVDSDVRRALLHALARNYKDHPQTYAFLQQRAEFHRSATQRQEAIEELVTSFRQNPKVFHFFGRLALSEPEPAVQVLILDRIRDLNVAENSVLELLKEIALSDAVQTHCRCAAVDTLAAGWPCREEILILLDHLFAASQNVEIRNQAAKGAAKVRAWKTSQWVDWFKGLPSSESFAKLPAVPPGFPALRISSMRLRNIRAFIDTDQLGFSNADGIPTRTTLLLGENSAGKSTLLRCIALASLGSDLSNQIERRPPSFLRANAEKGFIEVEFGIQLDESVTRETVGKLVVGLEIRAGEK